MSAPRWLTPDGRVLYRAEVSHHHVISERRDYKTPIEHRFRVMGGLVLLLGNQAHADLHRNVAPPPKINPHLMQDIYQHARRIDYGDQYDVFGQIVDYVAAVAVGMQCDENVQDANLLYWNLAAQSEYIDLGRLTMVRDAA